MQRSSSNNGIVVMECLLEKYKSNLDVQKVKLVYLTNNMKVIQLTNSRPGTFSFFIVLLKMHFNMSPLQCTDYGKQKVCQKLILE